MPAKKQEDPQKFDQKKFNKWIRQVQLMEINLYEVGFKRTAPIEFPNLIVNFSIEGNKIQKRDGGFDVVVFSKTIFSSTSGDVGEAKAFGELLLSFGLSYDFDQIPIDDQYYDQYFNSTLLHVWPYFRKYLSDFTGQIGLPPYTLSVLPPIDFSEISED